MIRAENSFNWRRRKLQLSMLIKLAPRIGREFFRKAQYKLRSGRLWRLRPRGNLSEISLLPLADLRSTDPKLAHDYYSGRFQFGAHLVETSGNSPFSLSNQNEDWMIALHSFQWLRHLRATRTELDRAHGAGLIQDWIIHWGNQRSSLPWRAEILAPRIIAWCAHAHGLLEKSNDEQNRTVRRVFSRQVGHLQNILPTLPVAYPKLLATIALAHAAVAIGSRGRLMHSSMRELEREIERQILPDGGHISRNPSCLLQVLINIIPLKQAWLDHGVSPSPIVLAAIDRMIAASQFFAHSNGTIARFNGSEMSADYLLDIILQHIEKSQDVQRSLPSTGYERLSHGKTVLLIDTGKPNSNASNTDAMAGCLSFELSCGKNKFIINCGLPESEVSRYIPFARASAAHSTAVIADTSSTQFSTQSRVASFLPSAYLSGPEAISVERRKLNGFSELNTCHDGYKTRFSLLHRRVLQLSNDGKILNGADRFESTLATPVRDNGHEIKLRFHLPPEINASLLASGHSVLLAAPNKQAWTFSCVDAALTLEESIDFSSPGGPRKTEQIVVTGYSAHNPEIRWTLEQKVKTSSRSKQTQKEPDLLLPLDMDEKPKGE